ncbi:MAG: CtsR family transcriptional regulator [Clostridiales bacterium]|uniref:CtsR family transcriptional regulator n=1 Tax=Clostridium sp. N3C TaxID=1776758 RepID=UPI00092DEAF6|nr:CtsR family transcriptional regulator [Clostridium sp. N3C]NLZ48124.1 CtsR family transcriptional regulator [Clostridiales bacterium]SCN23203.1 Transcriptional regulator CtsR [Clostridium sp. N3C]
MRLSDIIEEFIKDLLNENVDNELMIQRNELANHFSCAPSQINYVLTTRFTTDKGYYIESRRGGGGCIIIKRMNHKKGKNLLDTINERIGDSITNDKAVQIIEGLQQSNLITDREAAIMKATVNDRTLYGSENRNALRADILKSIMMILCHQ